MISYPGELTTRTADLTTSKILRNSVLCTDNRKYMCIDIKMFYICTLLERYEYMKIPVSVFPKHIKQQYNLEIKAKKGYVYVEIRRSFYGLPQAGKLTNTALKEHLAPYGYFEVAYTPGLWQHITRPIALSLVVYDFRVKYVHKDDANHFANSLENAYKLRQRLDREPILRHNIKMELQQKR